ncbi:MAG: bi-domain-containing oxidoreductase [Thermoleophilia bacterium]|nr:bi-domain-containing oxidoreductase [Thermoleophilia bacterium]
MKQVTQRLRDGRISVLDVPAPELRPEGVLVDVRASLLSAGTERKKVATGRESLIGKARARPDETRRVLEKARRDGIAETVRAVRSQLEQPSPLGYASAGVVVAAGPRVRDLAPGDRVACGGGGYAVHAEMNYVPGNLAVRVPDGVAFDEAAFATVGAIALHGVRRAGARLGERVAVVGLGLVGQLVGQILRAAACRVVGVDLSAELVDRALATGGADVAYAREALRREIPPEARDCDAVVLTAATPSSDPVELGARLARDRARVVVLGEVGLDVPRNAYYEKELALVASRSYGPGRYDREYEERGLDYPLGYVRWTERRNMAAFLELVAAGKVRVEPLVGARIPVDQAGEAYEELLAAKTSPLGILLEYPALDEAPAAPAPSAPPPALATPRAVAVVGAGSFATRILIPGLRDAGFSLRTVASASGLSAHAAAERFGFSRVTSVEQAIAAPDVGLVAIATRHSSHAALALRALRAGKAVFVEKPPCLTASELAELRAARAESGRLLAVGFNRRHAPAAQALRRFLAEQPGPAEILIRVNAGALPSNHWLNDLDEGGGRLLGEGCHFVDLALWLVGVPPERVLCTMRAEPGEPLQGGRSFTLTLAFGDGSLATIVYGARGADRLGKEYVEVHAGGRSAVLDDFRTLTMHGPNRPQRRHGGAQDKGHSRQFVALGEWVEGHAAPEPDPLDSMTATLAALTSAESGAAVRLDEPGRAAR